MIEINSILIKIGSWDLNPYLSFTVSALVELLAYIIVHLILDRIGRKKPYVLFAILFGLVALLVLPIQKYMTKDSKRW
jgi:MFS family permease